MTERPFRGDLQLYRELLKQAEQFNAAEILLNIEQWLTLEACVERGAITTDAGGQPLITVKGRAFRLKPSQKPPHGVLDLSGPEPCFEP